MSDLSVIAQPSIASRIMLGTAWLTAWRMFSRMLGFVSLLALAHVLVPADFGLVALASASAAAIDALSQIGVRDALVRLKGETADHYDVAFTLQAARGILTGLVLVAFGFNAGAVMGDSRLGPLLLTLAVLSVLSGFENIGTVDLARRLDFRSQVLLQAVPRVLGVVATVVAAFLLRSYWALVAGIVVTKVLSLASSYLVAPHRPHFSLRGWRYLLHFSFWSWAGSIAVLVWSRADTFLLGPALGSAVLGLYVISVEVALLPVTELIDPVGGALYSGFALASRTGAMGRGLALRVSSALSVCMVPLAIGISACSGYLCAALLGPKWAAAQPLVATFAAVSVMSPFSYVCGSALTADGHIRRAFFCNATAASLKCVAVVTTLSFTHDLRAIMLVNVAVVACEALMFVSQIWVIGGYHLREVAVYVTPAFMRVCLAGAASSCFVSHLPGAWSAVDASRLMAFLGGGLVGGAALSLYFATLFGLWAVSGRPDGPERVLAGLLGRGMAEFRSRYLHFTFKA